MRGDRPMSPNTTTCTDRPCFHRTGSFPSLVLICISVPSAPTNRSGLSLYGSYCLGKVTSKSVNSVDKTRATARSTEKRVWYLSGDVSWSDILVFLLVPSNCEAGAGERFGRHGAAPRIAEMGTGGVAERGSRLRQSWPSVRPLKVGT